MNLLLEALNDETLFAESTRMTKEIAEAARRQTAEMLRRMDEEVRHAVEAVR